MAERVAGCGPAAYGLQLERLDQWRRDGPTHLSDEQRCAHGPPSQPNPFREPRWVFIWNVSVANSFDRRGRSDASAGDQFAKQRDKSGDKLAGKLHLAERHQCGWSILRRYGHDEYLQRGRESIPN